MLVAVVGAKGGYNNEDRVFHLAECDHTELACVRCEWDHTELHGVRCDPSLLWCTAVVLLVGQ